MSYGVVLKEKEFCDGLTINDVTELFNLLDDSKAYPIEIFANEHECSAMGFISINGADTIGYDYTATNVVNSYGKELHNFIANILDDMDNETENHEYDFSGIKIYMSR